MNPSENSPATTPLAVVPGSVFPIRTLRDIFELPSYDHMERCLKELSKALLHSRASSDLFSAVLEHKGMSIPAGGCFKFPEVVEWKDDGKGEVGASFNDPDGKVIFSTRIVKKSPNT